MKEISDKLNVPIPTVKSKILSHQDDVLKFSLKFYKGDLEKAKDLSQDSLMKAIKYYKKIESVNNIKSWLYTIVKNTYLNESNKTKNKKTVYIGDGYSYQYNNVKIKNNNSGVSNLNVEFILSRINKISPANKEVLLMVSDNHSMKEISEKLNIPISTVKSKIFLGRKQLQKLIQPLLKQMDFEIRK